MRGLAVLCLAGTLVTSGVSAQEIEVDGPDVILRDVPFTITVSAPASATPTLVTVRLRDGTLVGDTIIPPLESVALTNVTVSSADLVPIVIEGPASRTEFERRVFPAWISILPPFVAIVLAFALREVVTSLFAGVFVGSLFLTGFNPLTATFMTANRFARDAVAHADHAAIILFTLLLGGMVGIVTRMGGMRAIVDAVAPLATTRRRAQVATWLAGLAVFFDDYSNSLIVGNTMRPLTDRLRISREKLAYIVDSTAAPVAAVFIVSTWIGYEVSLIAGGLELAAQQQSANPDLVAQLQSVSPFGIFLQTIPYLFYPLLAIFTVALIAYTGRDFGPMLKAEQRAASGKGLHREGAQLAADLASDLKEADNVPSGRWWNGALPVAALVVTVLAGLVTTGIASLGPDEPRTLRNIFGGADPYSPLMWGSILACIVALVLGASQRIFTVGQGIDAWLSGLRAMLLAIVILVFAWSLGSVTESLETASFLAGALSERLPPTLLPVSVFVVAAIIAFSTGTSWATMAILVPLVVPLAVSMVGTLDPASHADRAVLLGSLASVLAGAIWGDHCSPISDTTVLSSTASSCDHVDHVRTQLPYALLVGAVAIVCGNILAAVGVPAWLCLIIGIVAVYLLVRFLGKPDEIPDVPPLDLTEMRSGGT